MNNNNIVINSLLLNKNKNSSSSSSSSSSSQYKNKITSHAAKFPSIIIANHYLCLMNMNTNTSRCEGSPSLSSSPQHHHQQQQQQQQQQLDRQRSNEHEPLAAQQEEPPCSVCKYTGMTVCAGLSLYFIKLANENTTATSSNRTIAAIRTTKTNTTTATATNYFTALADNVVAANKATPMKNHRPFFYICSAGWAIAGVYRWYLD